MKLVSKASEDRAKERVKVRERYEAEFGAKASLAAEGGLKDEL